VRFPAANKRRVGTSLAARGALRSAGRVARFVFKTIVRRGPQFVGLRLAAEVGWLASLGGSFELLIVSREMCAFRTPTEPVFDRQASERHSIRLDRDLELSIQLDFLRS
jgi:hypothetical protein